MGVNVCQWENLSLPEPGRARDREWWHSRGGPEAPRVLQSRKRRSEWDAMARTREVQNALLCSELTLGQSRPEAEAAWGGSKLSIPGGMQGEGGEVLAGTLQKPCGLRSGSGVGLFSPRSQGTDVDRDTGMW